MRNSIAIGLICLFAIALSGCEEQELNYIQGVTDEINQVCLSSIDPELIVLVHDEKDREVFLETAEVSIKVIYAEEEVQSKARVVSVQDDTTNTSYKSFYKQLPTDIDNYDIEVTVTADGYQTKVTNITDFTPRCDEDNRLTELFYLTPNEVAIEEGFTTCSGFMSPAINVFVRDSSSDVLIENALVSLVQTSEDKELTASALYIPYDDNLSNSLTGAYFSLLEINAGDFDVMVSVSANGYHSSAVKIDNFIVDTSCMADNSILKDVYLCPLGTDCL